MNKKILYSFLILTNSFVLVIFGLVLGVKVQLLNNSQTKINLAKSISTKTYWTYNGGDSFAFSYPSNFVVTEAGQSFFIARIEDLQSTANPETWERGPVSGITIYVQENSQFLSTADWIKDKQVPIDEISQHTNLTVANKEAVRYTEGGICAEEVVLFARSNKTYQIRETNCSEDGKYEAVLKQILTSFSFKDQEQIRWNFKSKNGLVTFSYFPYFGGSAAGSYDDHNWFGEGLYFTVQNKNGLRIGEGSGEQNEDVMDGICERDLGNPDIDCFGSNWQMQYDVFNKAMQNKGGFGDYGETQTLTEKPVQYNGLSFLAAVTFSPNGECSLRYTTFLKEMKLNFVVGICDDANLKNLPQPQDFNKLGADKNYQNWAANIINNKNLSHSTKSKIDTLFSILSNIQVRQSMPVTILMPKDMKKYSALILEHVQDGVEGSLALAKALPFESRTILEPYSTNTVWASANAAARQFSGQADVKIIYLKIIGETAYVLTNIHIDGWAGVSNTLNQMDPVIEKTLLQFPQIKKVKFDMAPGDKREDLYKLL